ncbi:MAG: hypothetical protein ACOYID_05425 [Eubacteriales bacterium]|jgi:hypothetical protein|nr:hypothetical protein [Clostridiales bacterium]
MLEFIVNNIYFILTALAAAAACIILAKRGQIAKIRDIILALCVDAEIVYGSKTGEIKKASVLEAVYRLLPAWAKLIIPASELSKLVEEGKRRMDELAGSNRRVMALIYSSLPCPDTGEEAEDTTQ